MRKNGPAGSTAGIRVLEAGGEAGASPDRLKPAIQQPGLVAHEGDVPRMVEELVGRAKNGAAAAKGRRMH